MTISRCLVPAIILSLVFSAGFVDAADPFKASAPHRLILAHYMPWYAAPPQSERWGWHWTMNHFAPDNVTDQRREIAAEFYPLIGPYDSGDPDVLEYHLLLMKLSGIDGVIVDWYGLEEFRDYATLHRNTQRLVQQAERLGMRVAICYEDQTIPNLVSANRIGADQRVSHAAGEINWLAENWFKLRSYVRIDGRPVLLSFGHAGLSNDEWTKCLARLKTPVAYFSEHDRRSSAVGGFDWPIPKQGISHTERFVERSRSWTHSIPVAFPRFVDIYAKAKVNDGYGRIEDHDGKTFQTTIDRALASGAPMIQIATWNDWGEGTQIEPSIEFAYRDLEYLQQARRKQIDAGFRPQAADLRIPNELWQLRRGGTANKAKLDRIAELIVADDLPTARSLIESLKDRLGEINE